MFIDVSEKRVVYISGEDTVSCRKKAVLVVSTMRTSSIPKECTPLVSVWRPDAAVST
jgi:hypothetical protein